MIFERRRFVVTMGVIVQEKEKVENGLVFMVVLLPWAFKGGIGWVHLIRGATLTLRPPRSITSTRSGNPNWSYFGVLEKQQRWGKGWQQRWCGAGGRVG